MSVMDLLKSPKGIDLLQGLYDACSTVDTYMRTGDGCGIDCNNGVWAAYKPCQEEIATQQAIDRYKEIDGTPSKLVHKWIP